MKVINIFDFPKFVNYYDAISFTIYKTWEDCLKDSGINSPVFYENTYNLEITDEEYTWFILKWS
jgi:hypothetical protein